MGRINDLYLTNLFIEHQYGREEFVKGLESSQKRVDSYYNKNPDYRIVHDNLKNMNIEGGVIYAGNPEVLKEVYPIPL